VLARRINSGRALIIAWMSPRSITPPIVSAPA
jgi:hypothetical protein